GEFSWKVENMLNRVLDHTIQPTQPVIGLVQVAHGVLPEILSALRGERSVRTDLEAIKDAAERLAAGEQVHYVPAAAPVEPEPAQPLIEGVLETADAVEIAGVPEAPLEIASEVIAED